jgi:uncharacterized LabA/DUF88 family protein
VDVYINYERPGCIMSNFLYVDNSNLWIEGMHVAAVRAGLAPDVWGACEQRVCDPSWRVDFGRLMDFAGGNAIGRAVLFGSTPPTSDSLWGVARSKGFEVIVHERNARNKEKKVDTQIAVEMIQDSFERMAPGDTITLVSGDADHVPAVLKLRARGFVVEVCFWGHASNELRNSASKFVELDTYLDLLNANR